MTRDERKAAAEREVFLEFARAAGLPVIAESVQSRRPPEPDILCEFTDRGLLAFELVNLVDEDLMRTIAREVQRVTRGLAREPEGTWFGDPTLDLITQKLRNDYQTPYPMELLAYGDDTLLPYDVWAPTFEDRISSLYDDAMRRAQNAGKATFQRLWVVNLGRLARDRPVWFVHPLR